VKERDANGRTAEEVRLVPASGAAVIASTAMVSITAVTLLSVRGGGDEAAAFGLGAANDQRG
jgi:hypothetical protein